MLLKSMTHVTVTPTSGHAVLLRCLQHIRKCNVVIQISSVPEIAIFSTSTSRWHVWITVDMCVVWCIACI